MNPLWQLAKYPSKFELKPHRQPILCAHFEVISTYFTDLQNFATTVLNSKLEPLQHIQTDITLAHTPRLSHPPALSTISKQTRAGQNCNEVGSTNCPWKQANEERNYNGYDNIMALHNNFSELWPNSV